jgi:predicted amidohydrolase
MQAAVVQMLVEDSRDDNLATATRLVRDVAAAGANIVVLPEVVDYMGPDEGVADIKSSIPGPVSDQFADLAGELGIWLLAGSIHEAIDDDHRTYNTSLLFSPDGVEIARYRKIHLYDVQIPGSGQCAGIRHDSGGADIVTTDIAGHTAGLAICYDVRFPELFRALADEGAELVFLPAAFTLFTGKDHWEVLIRARAIENQCYMLAPGNRVETSMAALPTVVA